MSGWIRVSKEEMARIRAKAAGKKAKRAAKAVDLWPARAVDPDAPPKRRTKKSLRQLQRDRNDALWSLAVRRRDTHFFGPRCRICGQVEESVNAVMVGYHLVPKKRGDFIRWLMENGVQGCSRCNFGERMNPGKYRDKHIALVGRAVIEGIEARARAHADLSMAELKEIQAWLAGINERGPDFPIPSPPACLTPRP